MHFSTIMTKSISRRDERLLLEASLILRCLSFTGQKLRSEIENWILPKADCHSVARLLSMFMKDCEVVDGYLFGLGNISENELGLQTTFHSWLVTPDKAIIDPWPMGIVIPGSAILVPTQQNVYCAHGSNLYHKSQEVLKEFDVSDAWRRARTHKRILKKYCTAEIVDAEVDFLQKL